MNEIKNELTTIIAPEISCGGCTASIKKALGGLDGVADVAVEIETKKVRIEHNAEISRADLVSALDRAGFSAE